VSFPLVKAYRDKAHAAPLPNLYCTQPVDSGSALNHLVSGEPSNNMAAVSSGGFWVLAQAIPGESSDKS